MSNDNLAPSENLPNIQEIHVFLEIYGALNITKASESLHLSQSQVSRILARLERKVAAKLFSRSTSGLTLTAAGTHFLRFCRSIRAVYMQEMRGLNQRLEGQAGEIRVSVLPSVAFEFMGEWTHRFHLACPEATLTVTDDVSGNALQSVLDGKSDAAIAACLIKLPDGSEHRLFDEVSRMRITPLVSESFYLVTPQDKTQPSYPDWGYALSQATLGFTEETSIHRALKFIARAENADYSPETRTNSPLTIAGLIESGRGCSIVPQSNLGIMGIRATTVFPLPSYHRVICAATASTQASPLVDAFIASFPQSGAFAE